MSVKLIYMYIVDSQLQVSYTEAIWMKCYNTKEHHKNINTHIGKPACLPNNEAISEMTRSSSAS